VRIGINARFLAAPVGGVQRFAHGVTAQLIRRTETVILTPRGAHVPAAWRDHAAVHTGRLGGQLWEQLELPGTAARSCDVLFHPANTGPVAGPPAVLMLHDVFPLEHPEWYAPAFALWYRMLMPATARRAAAILTTSAHTARGIANSLRIAPQRISAVPQGLAPFDAPASVTDVCAALSTLGVTRPYALVPGAGDARKNVPFAESVVALSARSTDETLTLVAFGDARRHVHGRTASAGGMATVRVGRVSDDQLRALYTGAAAVLCPSLAEGFGRVPLEAMSCGTPCIVARHQGTEEVLAGTPARLLPLEPHAWAAALREVMRQHERVGPADNERLRRRWSWDAAAAAVLVACEAASSVRTSAP
jgi:hypothetical protein